MLIVDEKVTDRIEFLNKDKTGTGSFFIVWRELPYDGYMDYLDAAMDIEIDPLTQQPKTEIGKIKLGSTANMLIEQGLVGLENVQTKEGRVLTKEDYKLLPFPYLMQIVNSVQMRNVGEASVPNA